MTQEEKGRLFLELKAERDAARDTLRLAEKKAKKLSDDITVVQAALDGQADWVRVGESIRFSSKTLGIMDCPYPSEADILDVLETIRSSKKAIQEYEEFVR